MRVVTSATNVLKPSAIALGNFDGVHLGHQQVLKPILSVTNAQGDKLVSTTVTFTPHPREFFSGKSWQLLTPLNEKVVQLEALGIQQLVLLPFDRELATLSPQQFIEQILVGQLQAQKISVGEDFRFGYQRQGRAEDLKKIAGKLGITVTICRLEALSVPHQSSRISSSLIRQALTSGDIIQANHMLGREFSLQGTVIQGEQLGRTLGFPTANLQIASDKLLPTKGVYSVNAILPDGAAIAAVMNIGNRPTVDGKQLSVEVHLLNWSGDLYGQELCIKIEDFIRPEQKFSSIESLKAQIAADCQARQKRLESCP